MLAHHIMILFELLVDMDVWQVPNVLDAVLIVLLLAFLNEVAVFWALGLD